MIYSYSIVLLARVFSPKAHGKTSGAFSTSQRSFLPRVVNVPTYLPTYLVNSLMLGVVCCFFNYTYTILSYTVLHDGKQQMPPS